MFQNKYPERFYKRIHKCTECGHQGILLEHAEHGSGYKCVCAFCTNSGKAKKTRMGALHDWNKKNRKEDYGVTVSKFLSGVIYKNKVIIMEGGCDDRSEINKACDNGEDCVMAALYSKENEWWVDPEQYPEKWVLVTEKNEKPDWFALEEYEKKFRAYVCGWWKDHVFVEQKINELTNGYYLLKYCEVNIVGDGAKVIIDDTEVMVACSNSIIKEMRNRSVVRKLCGTSIVQRMCENSIVQEMSDCSAILEMCDYSIVQKMSEKSAVKKMRTNSIVQEMNGSECIILEMTGNAAVLKMEGSVVLQMFDDSSVQEVYFPSSLVRMYDSSFARIITLDEMSDGPVYKGKKYVCTKIEVAGKKVSPDGVDEEKKDIICIKD